MFEENQIMKTHIRTALTAISAMALAASAHAAIYNGDLLIGFSSGSGNDLIYDLGSPSSLSDGQQWDLSSFVSSFDLSTVQWGVVASQKLGGVGNLWATTTGLTIAPQLPGNPQWAGPDTAVKSIGSAFTTLGAGNSITPPSGGAGSDNSWYVQTVAGPLTTDYINNYDSPNNTGIGSASFYHVVADNSPASLAGIFSLDSGGQLTLSVVPEPSVLSLVAGLGLLAACFRGKLARKD